ncbi:MAG: tRNA (guanosine(37)-N1)-methyltransferase TrmD [Alphaproteobacteria bacterium]
MDQVSPALDIVILTLFPEMFPGLLGHSLAGRGLKEGLWRYKAVNMRDFAKDRHKTVDDTPFGGGAGMVLRPDVIAAALDSVEKENGTLGKLVYFSPRGRVLTQAYAKQLVGMQSLVFLCGRYEGVDERVLKAYNAEEVSIGDYVLSGGEVAAMVTIDVMLRLVPGVMGNDKTLEEESFADGLLEYPQFTRPADWQDKKGGNWAVPELLRQGNHQQIAQWRREQSEAVTKEKRPDLWCRYWQKKSV